MCSYTLPAKNVNVAPSSGALDCHRNTQATKTSSCFIERSVMSRYHNKTNDDGDGIDCEQPLFFFRFSEGSAWSFACLGRFARRTKKPERLLVV